MDFLTGLMTREEETADRVDGEQFSTAPKMNGHTNWLRVTHGPMLCLPSFFSPRAGVRTELAGSYFRTKTEPLQMLLVKHKFLDWSQKRRKPAVSAAVLQGSCAKCMSTGALSGGKAEGQICGSGVLRKEPKTYVCTWHSHLEKSWAIFRPQSLIA